MKRVLEVLYTVVIVGIAALSLYFLFKYGPPMQVDVPKSTGDGLDTLGESICVVGSIWAIVMLVLGMRMLNMIERIAKASHVKPPANENAPSDP